MSENLLAKAIDIAGLQNIARACNVTYQAVRKWERLGRLPRTEWTGETHYAHTIESLTSGQIKATDLLASFPAPSDQAA